MKDFIERKRYRHRFSFSSTDKESRTLPIAVLIVLMLALSPCATPRCWAVQNVIYPQIAERSPDDYGYKVLELALQKSGEAFSLSLSPKSMNQERARALLKLGDISVLDTGTNPDFENQFDPVYFPVDRGLSGYRLLLINKTRAAEFLDIGTLAQLRKETAGQGPGWSDTKVLRAAGITVETSEFESLFRMVNANRFDFFPLGVEEAFGLLERYRQLAPDTIIAPHIALQYPFARLFFVRKGNTQLRNAIYAGLTKAFADGSLQRLLDANKSFHDSLLRADLHGRTLIKLDNPYLTKAFRQIPSAYFYAP